MSISFDFDSSTISSTVADGVTNDATNEAIIVHYGGTDSLRRYDLTTGSQAGGSVTVTGDAVAVALVNSASAITFQDSGTTSDVVELASGYRQVYSGGTAVSAFDKGQLASGDITNSRVLAASNTTGSLIKFDGNTFTLSTISPIFMSGQKATTVLCKGSNRWLIGTDASKVFECDHSGNLYGELTVTYNPDNGRFVSGTPVRISGLSFANDTLLVTTRQGFLHCFNWATKEELYKTYLTDAEAASRGTVLCAAVSSTCILSHNYSVGGGNNVAIEIDFGQIPPVMRDVLNLDSTGFVVASGLGTSGKGWVLQRTVDILRIFTVTPRTTTTQASVLEDPPGTAVAGELIRIIDDGVGSSSVELSTPISAASTTFRATPGKDYIEIGSYGSGVNEKFDLREYST